MTDKGRYKRLREERERQAKVINISPALVDAIQKLGCVTIMYMSSMSTDYYFLTSQKHGDDPIYNVGLVTSIAHGIMDLYAQWTRNQTSPE